MATFPDIKPTYGTRKNNAPVNRVIRLADGFEQRIVFGLAQNQNPKVFNFTFNVSETDSDTIETFLDARANDQDSFEYTPEGDSERKFVCESWTKSIPYNNRATINATFREVFEP